MAAQAADHSGSQWFCVSSSQTHLRGFDPKFSIRPAGPEAETQYLTHFD